MGFDITRIDDVIHGRIRLGIIAYLATMEAADFTELKTALDTTAGNLSIHLRKLEEAGYVKVTKSIMSRKSLTRIQITKAGRTAFLAYLTEVRALVDSYADGKPPSASVQSASRAALKRKQA